MRNIKDYHIIEDTGWSVYIVKIVLFLLMIPAWIGIYCIIKHFFSSEAVDPIFFITWVIVWTVGLAINDKGRWY